MLVECLLVLILVIFVYQRWQRKNIYDLGRQLDSGVTALPLIGHSYLFLGNSETRMKAFQILGRDAISKENGLTSFWLGSSLYTMIADPEAADTVSKTCLEKDDLMKMATLFLGNGTVFAPVSIWRPRRKVLYSAFATKNMKHFQSIFLKQSNILAEQLSKKTDTGALSIWSYYTTYTMDVIAEATFGYQINSQKDSEHPFMKAFVKGLEHCSERLLSPWLHPELVYYNLPVYKKLLSMKNYLWGFVGKFVVKKRAEMKAKHINSNEISKGDTEEIPKTFLEMLINYSGGENGYTDIEVIEEMMLLMMAGNDTSAITSSFVSLMMSRHPKVQEKLFEELQEVFGDCDRLLTAEDLPRLVYLDAVIKETLRHYPPAPIITRRVDKETILPSGLTLVPGTGIMINIWALHRNPRYWGDDAEVFRPERFLETPLKHPAAFIPFSVGPRNCIAAQFAMTSMKTVLSTVFRRFKMLPAHKHGDQPPIRLQLDLLMRDVNGYQIEVERRKSNKI